MKQALCLSLVVLLAACGGDSPSSITGPTAPSSTSNVAGSYDLTLTASSACSANLSAAARVLHYRATISQAGTQWQTSLSGGQLVTATLQGTVSGSTVSISVISVGDIGIGLIGVVVSGFGGTGSVAPNGDVAGTFNAQFNDLAAGSCNSFDHQFRLVRR